MSNVAHRIRRIGGGFGPALPVPPQCWKGQVHMRGPPVEALPPVAPLCRVSERQEQWGGVLGIYLFRLSPSISRTGKGAGTEMLPISPFPKTISEMKGTVSKVGKNQVFQGDDKLGPLTLSPPSLNYFSQRELSLDHQKWNFNSCRRSNFTHTSHFLLEAQDTILVW